MRVCEGLFRRWNSSRRKTRLLIRTTVTSNRSTSPSEKSSTTDLRCISECGFNCDLFLQLYTTEYHFYMILFVISHQLLFRYESCTLYSVWHIFEIHWTLFIYFYFIDSSTDLIQCVVRSMEIAWLQHWCCLLAGSLDARDQQLLEETTIRILGNYKSPLSVTQKQLLQVRNYYVFVFFYHQGWVKLDQGYRIPFMLYKATKEGFLLCQRFQSQTKVFSEASF